MALTNTYLYRGIYNSYYYDEFMKVSGLDSILIDIDNFLYGDQSKFALYFWYDVRTKIKSEHYSSICNSDLTVVCAHSKLTYS